MTHVEYIDWLCNARAGDRIEYHRGLLHEDCDVKVSKLIDKDRLRLLAVRKTAWSSHEDGHTTLVQQRHGEGDYSYFAQVV